MRNARLCDKWDFPVTATLPELHAKHGSYLSYLAHSRDRVASKCLATEWLFQGVCVASAREYFAGVGLTAMIITHVCRVERWRLGETSDECLRQLAELSLPGAEVVQEPAKKALLNPGDYELHVLDFPAFTMTRLLNGWAAPLGALFQAKPRYVMVTDTALSYLSVHARKYSLLSGVPVHDADSYVAGLNRVLNTQYGYQVTRCAQRGRDALYVLVEPGQGNGFEFKAFGLKESAHGFAWVE